MAWLSVALIEWRRAFVIRQLGGGSGRRDFRWLSLLLSLTIMLALFLWSSREGLLNQLMNVSVGYIPGSGIPLWVIADDSGINPKLIDGKLLQHVSTLGITRFHPYREVEPHEVSLPIYPEGNSEIWRKRAPKFEGRAVSLRDPLWQLGAVPHGSEPAHVYFSKRLPLEIVLSKSLFQRYFDCHAYEQALEQRLPRSMLPAIQHDVSQSATNTLHCLDNDKLWLDVRTGIKGDARELVEFRIRWQIHIPAMGEISFLFPLPTLHALETASHNRALRYYPEAEGDPGWRIKQLRIWPGADRQKHETFVKAVKEKTVHCLRNTQIEGAYWITLERALPRRWVERCIEQYGITLKPDNEAFSLPYVTYVTVVVQEESYSLRTDTDSSITTACETLTMEWRGLSTCRDSDGSFQTGHMTEGRLGPTSAFGGYPKALAYVPQRALLVPTLEQLKSIPRHPPTDVSPALHVQPAYQDALIRFSFISDVMDLLEKYYGVFFISFLGLLLWVQMSIVIGHRRHSYGLLLAKGMHWGHIWMIVLVQVTLSFVFGLVGATVVLVTLRFSLSFGVADILNKEHYKDLIFSDLDLLPASGFDYVWLVTGSLFLSYVIALAVLIIIARIRPSRSSEPAYLLNT